MRLLSLCLTFSLLVINLALGQAQSTDRATEFLRYQIQSADLPELQQMATDAKISSSLSSTEALRAALYQYYKITPPVEGVNTIDHADRLWSFKTVDLNQQTTVLEGSVAISILEGSIYHSISAERIEINSDTKTINAFGHVVYQTGTGNELQYFTAESFVFSSANYSALVVMVAGSSTQKNSNSEDITFYYSAKHMYKGENNLVTLDGVVVTSCDRESPHYRIKASKIWSLGDNEWAAKGLTFYLGHVPILYLPIYYQGDFFFNPVFSYDWRRGATINTTTYFMGGKQANALFDFNLMNSDSNGSGKPSTSSVKLMADYYGKLGYFAGLGAHDDRADFELTAGIGVSRTVYDNGSIVGGGTNPYETDPNYSYVFGHKVPFRYGLQTKASKHNITMDINLFSDPFFAKDFFNRSENPLLFAFLLDADGGNRYNRLYQTQSSLSYKNRFTFTNQAVQYLNIDYLSLDFVQKSRINYNESSSSPNYEFYVPSRINLPNSQIELGARWYLKQKDEIGLDVSNDIEPTSERPSAYIFKTTQRLWQQSFYYKMVINERIFLEPDSNLWRNPTQIVYNTQDFRNYSAANVTIGFDVNTNDNFFSLKTAIKGDGRYQSRFGGDEPKTSDYWKVDQLNRALYFNNIINVEMKPFVDNERLNESFLSYALDSSFFRNYYDRDLAERRSAWDFNPTSHHSSGLIKYNTGRYWLFAGGNVQLPTLATEGDGESGVGLKFASFSNQVSVYTNQHSSPLDSTGVALRSEYKPLSFLSMGQNSELDFSRLMHHSDVYFKLFGFTASYVWEERALYRWDKDNYLWQSQVDDNGAHLYKFIPSYLNLKLDQDIQFKPFWQDRAQFKLLLDAEWLLDWHKYNDSKLTSGLGLGLELYKIVDFKLQINSINRASYLYIPFMRNALGIEKKYSFWGDLVDSINFFDPAKRQNSRFKLANVELTAHFDLHDWDLYFQYIGEPDYNSADINPNKMWTNSFSLFVVWRPFPSSKTQISNGNGLWHTGPLNN